MALRWLYFYRVECDDWLIVVVVVYTVSCLFLIAILVTHYHGIFTYFSHHYSSFHTLFCVVVVVVGDVMPRFTRTHIHRRCCPCVHVQRLGTNWWLSQWCGEFIYFEWSAVNKMKEKERKKTKLVSIEIALRTFFLIRSVWTLYITHKVRRNALCNHWHTNSTLNYNRSINKYMV